MRAGVLWLPLVTQPIVQGQSGIRPEFILDVITHVPRALSGCFAGLDFGLIDLAQQEAGITEAGLRLERSGKTGLRGLESEVAVGDILSAEVGVPTVVARAKFDAVLAHEPGYAVVILPVGVVLALLADVIAKRGSPG